MNPTLLTILGFAAAVMAVLGVYSLVSDIFLRDRSRVSRRVDDEFRSRQRERAQRSLLFKNLGEQSAESAAQVMVKDSWRESLELLIERSGVEITPRRLFMFMAMAGALLAAVVAVSGLNPWMAFPAALCGAFLPVGYVMIKRNARMNRLLTQLPDAFDLMSRCIRAGQTMSQALQAVTDEFDAPISAEFSLAFEQMNLGLPPEVAMRDLARRTGLLELKVFVLAMLIQTQTGGNLAEMLDKLSAIIRERSKIKGKLSALTAEGRLQAIILLALPPGLFLILLAINRPYAEVLLAHPILLVAIGVMELMGALWIRRIVNFDF
jgi:tight adherence protein B